MPPTDDASPTDASRIEEASLEALARRAARLFAERFGAEPEILAAAPGRVNLIGEHTDYNGGHVLPMAIERYTIVAASSWLERAAAAELYSVSLEQSDAFDWREPASLGEGPHWSSYSRGVLAGCLARGWRVPAFRALIDSTVPIGGGLSSSAALEVAAATLLERLASQRFSLLEKTLVRQQAEHRFAGVPCGVMDQFVSVHAQADSLLLIDCRTHEGQHTPFDDPEVAVLIVNSRVKHELAAEANPYAERRAACETAARALGVELLCAARREQLDTIRNALDPVVYRRARHVLDEDARTIAAADAARRRDWRELGQLMVASHVSMRDDFEITCREVDLLVELARSQGEAGGVYGARMTGGGFGGCTVNLVRQDAAAALTSYLAESYTRETGRVAEIFTTRPAAGARLLA